jgi:AraC-like DNA-binding protein
MAELIRSASLTHFAGLARSTGIDPATMLRKVRLPLTCLERRDLRIPVRNVRRLLEISAEVSGLETFGLRLAERGDLSNLGPLALLIREQATIGTALEALSRFIHIHNEGMRLVIDRREGLATITFLIRGAMRQSTELALGSINRAIGFLCGGNWRPLQLPGAECSIERVADHLGCNRRTVHRRLVACGTSFSEVLDNERAEIVMRLIQERSRPLAEIAEMIGFSAQSAMARWFRERFGCSITAWRSDPRRQGLAAAGRW